MTTRGISSTPGFNPITHAKFYEIVTNKWNLPPEYAQNAEHYFLRRWTAAEIYDMLSDQGIKLYGVSFLPLFKKESLSTYNTELAKGDKLSTAFFWLSFRSIRYPVGSGKAGYFMSYVLIQVDDKG